MPKGLKRNQTKVASPLANPMHYADYRPDWYFRCLKYVSAEDEGNPFRTGVKSAREHRA
jgi:hypothetical protein